MREVISIPTMKEMNTRDKPELIYFKIIKLGYGSASGFTDLLFFKMPLNLHISIGADSGLKPTEFFHGFQV